MKFIYYGDEDVLSIIKRHRFLSWLLGTLCILGLRALYYYANGQAVASAHLDGHVAAAEINTLFAIVLAIIFVIVFIIKRKKELFKWFLIPVVLVGFAPIHLYIGSLFDCCPCCCTPRHIHQWNIVIIATVITILLIVLIVKVQVRKPTLNI